MNKDEAPASPKDAALRLALEALEIYVKGYADRHKSLYPTITAIKQALKETPRVSPEPEPVATVYEGAIAKWNLPEKFTGFLYSSPPKREPLTDRDNAIIRFAVYQFMSEAYARLNAAAQDKDNRHFRSGAVDAFAKDAKDAEVLLAKLSAAHGIKGEA